MRCDKDLLQQACGMNGKEVSEPKTNVFEVVLFVEVLQIVKIDKVVLNGKCIYS